MEDLEHKLRRSSTLLENNVFRDYLAYASLVRDPHEVYNYMEENKIGIDEPEFWTSKLNLSIKMAQYDTFVSLLKQIYKNKALRKYQPSYIDTPSTGSSRRWRTKCRSSCKGSSERGLR